jgi:hypothetical protein
MNGAGKRKRKKWLTVFLGVAILAAWLVYATIFVYRINRSKETTVTAEVQRSGQQESREEWFAIYQHGTRAGYSHGRLLPLEGGYSLTEELSLRLSFLGEIQELVTTIHAKLEPDFSMKSFTFQLQAGPITYGLSGTVADGSLVLASQMAGEKRTQTIPLSHPVYLGSAMKSFVSQQHLRVGDTYRLALFDPATLSQTMVPLRVAARETIRIGSRNLEAYRVEMLFRGLEFRTWISPYGELLKEEGFLGMTLVRTDAEGALQGFDKTVAAELVGEAAVVPDRPIDRPRQLKRLRLALAGISGEGWDLEGGRQRWQRGELTVAREPLDEITPVKIPWSRPEVAWDLQPTLLVQSDSPVLKAQAAAIVGGESDALRAATLISSWVHHNLDKRPTLSIPNALEVYRRRAGDCNEHSVLFAALARAAGIPTRIAAGLLYTQGRFFYHAWNEAYVGEWLAVDPLLNQVPADPTHIRLIVGELDRQVQLVRVIGRLGIRVLDYE